FDAAGRLRTITNRRGKGLTFGYTAAGVLSSVTDAGGRVVQVRTTSVGRISQLVLPDNRTVSYAYTADPLTKVTDPDGAVTVYGYDAAGRLSTITDALGHKQVTTVYRADGRVGSQTDVFGQVTRFDWDPVNQISKVTDPDGVTITDGFKDN